MALLVASCTGRTGFEDVMCHGAACGSLSDGVALEADPGRTNAGDSASADPPPDGDTAAVCTTEADVFTGTWLGQFGIMDHSWHRYVGTWFVADAGTGGVCAVGLYLDKVGAPTGTLYASIWSDDAGASPTLPASQIGTESMGVEAASVVDGTYVLFAGMTGVEAQAGTAYWVVVRSDAAAADAANFVRWWYTDDKPRPETSVANDAVSNPWQDNAWSRASFELFK